MQSDFDPEPYLERLENLVDVDHVLAAEARQSAAWEYRPVDRRTTIVTCRDDWRHVQHDWPPGWPQIPYGQAFRDPARMLVAELWRAYEGALLKDDRVYTIRPNYGLVIIPAILGCVYEQQGDEMPWTVPLPDRDAVRAMIQRGMPDLNQGLGRQVWETGVYFVETLARYPRLKRVVRVGCPDPQGPFNLASSIVGTDLFLAVIEDPDLVHQLLGFLTEVYIAFMSHHKEMTGEPQGVGYTFSYRYKGSARIVDDSAVMLSGAMYQEFCVPYNTQIAQALDGALGHFCGKGDQLFDAFASTPGVYAINFGNPEMQDLAARYEVAARYKVCLLWDGEAPQGYDHITTGIIHKRIAKSWAEAEAMARELDAE
jgi:hypothetical protein